MLSDEQREAKRKHDRERIAAIRAVLTTEEKAFLRKEYDRAYREKHREERREYGRRRYHESKQPSSAD